MIAKFAQKTRYKAIFTVIITVLSSLFLFSTASADCGLPQCHEVTETMPALFYIGIYTFAFDIYEPAVNCGVPAITYSQPISVAAACRMNEISCTIAANNAGLFVDSVVDTTTLVMKRMTVTFNVTDVTLLNALTDICVFTNEDEPHLAANNFTYTYCCNNDNPYMNTAADWTLLSGAQISDSAAFLQFGSPGYPEAWGAISQTISVPSWADGLTATVKLSARSAGDGLSAPFNTGEILVEMGNIYTTFTIYPSTAVFYVGTDGWRESTLVVPEVPAGDTMLYISANEDAYQSASYVDDVCVAYSISEPDDPVVGPTPTPTPTATPLPGTGGYCPRDCVPAPASPETLLAPVVTWAVSTTNYLTDWRDWLVCVAASPGSRRASPAVELHDLGGGDIPAVARGHSRCLSNRGVRGVPGRPQNSPSSRSAQQERLAVDGWLAGRLRGRAVAAHAHG